jgi:hypothetical protein
MKSYTKIAKTWGASKRRNSQFIRAAKP